MPTRSFRRTLPSLAILSLSTIRILPYSRSSILRVCSKLVGSSVPFFFSLPSNTDPSSRSIVTLCVSKQRRITLQAGKTNLSLLLPRFYEYFATYIALFSSSYFTLTNARLIIVKMLITNSHQDVETSTGTMRVNIVTPKISGYKNARFPGVVVFSEIYNPTGPVMRYAELIASRALDSLRFP